MPIANHIGGACRSAADNFLPETLRFVSTCPQCLKERQQRGYTRPALSGFLRTGRKIEGYCVACDAFWPIESAERTALVKEVLG
jgi:hypothetical protein